MKLTRTLLALAALSLAVSPALAAPLPGKGKPDRSARCKPAVSFVLKGTLVSTNAAARPSTLTMDVVKANKHARRFVGREAVVQVVEQTKIRREGRAALADLVPGDLVKVQVRTCKPASGAAGEAPALVAKRVVARPAAQGEKEAEQEGGNGSTP